MQLCCMPSVIAVGKDETLALGKRLRYETLTPGKRLRYETLALGKRLTSQCSFRYMPNNFRSDKACWSRFRNNLRPPSGVMRLLKSIFTAGPTMK